MDPWDADDLRYAFELLSYVAWDLADGWACAINFTFRPLESIRQRPARGW